MLEVRALLLLLLLLLKQRTRLQQQARISAMPYAFTLILTQSGPTLQRQITASRAAFSSVRPCLCSQIYFNLILF